MVVTPPAQRPAAEPAAQAAPSRLAIFAALNRRNFRYFWFAQISAVSAQAMEFVALAWLVLELTGSPFILGLTSLAHAAPTLVFALFAGAAADRMDRRRLLWAIHGVASVVYIGVGTLVLVQAIQTWMVVMVALLIGCLRVMDQPARHGMIPHTVPRDDLPNAIAMASLAFQVPRPVAPAIAGVLIAITGIGPTYLVIAGYRYSRWRCTRCSASRRHREARWRGAGWATYSKGSGSFSATR